MASERISGERVKVNTESQADLENRLAHAKARLEEAKTDVFILEDVLHRRFKVNTGLVAAADQLYLHGMTEREFDLNLLDD